MNAIEVFPGWQGKSLEETLGLCRELLEDMSFPSVRAWR